MPLTIGLVHLPQPKPDEDNPGHYLPVFKTPFADNKGQIREVDDWQPRVHITSLFKEGKISLNNKDAIKETASGLGIDQKLVVSCLEHLKFPLRVQQFLCFWKLFVALNNCANFFGFLTNLNGFIGLRSCRFRTVSAISSVHDR